MKKAILLFTIITFTAGVSTFAQDSMAADGTKPKKMRSQSEMGGGRMAMLDSLNLSAEQKQQVQTELASMKQKRAEIKNDNSLSDDAKTEKMKALREEEKKKMQSVLTAEQQKKYEEMTKNRKAGSAEQ